MNSFVRHWEITKKWQLLYPIAWVVILAYSSWLIMGQRFDSMVLGVSSSILVFGLFIYVSLFMFKKLENRWGVDARWRLIRIFLVFAITGTSSLFVTRPLFVWLGFTKDVFGNSQFSLILFYLVKVLAVLPIYKLLLLVFAWLFGEWHFFYPFVKKIISRLGPKKKKL